MYSNNIGNSQESTTILNACTKKSLETYWSNKYTAIVRNKLDTLKDISERHTVNDECEDFITANM